MDYLYFGYLAWQYDGECACVAMHVLQERSARSALSFPRSRLSPGYMSEWDEPSPSLKMQGPNPLTVQTCMTVEETLFGAYL